MWEFSAFLRGMKMDHTHTQAHWLYPHHYMEAVQGSDLLIQPDIPIKAYVPGCVSIEQLIAAGEAATLRALEA